MLRKLILGLVAAASLSTLALAPTAASAKHFGFGGGFHQHHHNFYRSFGYVGGGYVGSGYGDDSCFVTRRVPTPYGYRLRVFNVCGY